MEKTGRVWGDYKSVVLVLDMLSLGLTSRKICFISNLMCKSGIKGRSRLEI